MDRIEALTSQFYEWERRCRGWDLYQYPIDLEPSFAPFFFHSVPEKQPIIDDGLQTTLFTRLFRAIKNAFAPEQQMEMPEPTDEGELDPFPVLDDESLIALSVSLPKDQKVGADEMEHLLVMLSQSRYPISFEIIGTNTTIRIQFVCRESDADYVHNQIIAFFPSCGIHDAPVTDILIDQKHYFSLDFGIREEFMRPLKIPKNFDLDPFIGLFGVLENLKKGEQIVIQIIFKGALNPWAESIIRSVADNTGGSFFMDAPDMVKLAQEKILAPLYATVIRVIGSNDSGDPYSVDRMADALVHATQSPYNSLIPLSGDPESSYDLEDIMYRQSHRLGMLLNSKELSTLVHFPSASVVSHKLSRNTKKTKEAPEIFAGHKLILGINRHQGQELNVTISPSHRLKHTHIIGATGTGKSTLLLTSIIQDISYGEGLAVLDPHGDLIESILSWVHPDRHKDVILIDPSDTEFPVGFNILEAHSEIEKDILSSDLVAVFRRLSTSWGDQMNSLFANAILAFLESTKGGTLIDLRRFLIEKPFRDHFLTTVTDPSIVYYWQKEFPILKTGSIGPILTRLDSFLRPKLIRNMVAQQKSLDFEQILDTKKILLVKLPQGLIGVENSYLLGTFIVSKIQQAAMARQAKDKADRSNFYLYIDEFHQFSTPSMSTILTGTRKYGLGLILAHQDMQQVLKTDSELASAVTSNAGTRICFRLGDIDAKRFEGGFSFFDATDLQNLDIGESVIRIERTQNDCNLQSIPYQELSQDIAKEIKDRVIECSRKSYGTPKEDVEVILKNIHTGYNYAPPSTEPQTTPPIQKVHDVYPKTIEPIPTPIAPQEKKQETQHRYLQSLIKRMAESRGYTASIEEPTPDGKGKVDVSLQRNTKRIAVEIKDTSKEEWELHNIAKCLAAGYDTVIACSTDAKVISRMQKKIEEKFIAELRERILALVPDDLFLYLDSQIAKEASKEVRVKGYRVKVEYSPVSEQEMSRKREAIAKSVIESLKKK